MKFTHSAYKCTDLSLLFQFVCKKHTMLQNVQYHINMK